MSRFTCKCSNSNDSHAPAKAAATNNNNNNDHNESQVAGDSGDDLIKTWAKCSMKIMKNWPTCCRWKCTPKAGRQAGKQAGRQTFSQPASRPDALGQAPSQPHAIPVIISVNNHITIGYVDFLFTLCLALQWQQSKPKLSKLSLSKGHRKRLASCSMMGLHALDAFSLPRTDCNYHLLVDRFDNAHHDLRRFRFKYT